MKRSTVEKLIKNLFDAAPPNPNEMNADNLLGWLEEIGMQPPPYIKRMSYVPGNKEAIETIRQGWEPEDD